MKIIRSILGFILFGWYRKIRHDKRIDIISVFIKNVGIQDSSIPNKETYSIFFKDGTKVKISTKFYYVWHNDKYKKKKKNQFLNGKIIFTNNEVYEWQNSSPSWETIFLVRKYFVVKQQKEKILKIKKTFKRMIQRQKKKIELRRQRKETKKLEKKRQEEIYVEFLNKHLPKKVLRKRKLEELEK